MVVRRSMRRYIRARVGMQINTAHTLYEAFGTDQCAWVHSGRFHDEHTADLILLGEGVAERTGVSRDIRNRLAFVMVEAFQNVIRHGAERRSDGKERPMILLRACAAGFTVATANTVRSEDEDKLVRMLADLRGKPKEQLKELFLQRLQGNKVSERGGAGLGLIEMARRSGRELVHTVSRRDDRTSMFTLQVGIAAGGQSGREDHADGTDALQAIVSDEEVLLAYRGNMSPSVGQAMVRMLEKGVDDRPERTVARTRAWLAANELLNEMFGEQEEQCIVALGSQDGSDFLAVGMMLAKEKAKEVTRSAAQANAMNPMEQARKYREGLLAKAKGEPAPGLGFMDLVRTGGGRVQCAEHAHGESTFITLMIQL